LSCYAIWCLNSSVNIFHIEAAIGPVSRDHLWCYLVYHRSRGREWKMLSRSLRPIMTLEPFCAPFSRHNFTNGHCTGTRFIARRCVNTQRHRPSVGLSTTTHHIAPAGSTRSLLELQSLPRSMLCIMFLRGRIGASQYRCGYHHTTCRSRSLECTMLSHIVYRMKIVRISGYRYHVKSESLDI